MQKSCKSLIFKVVATVVLSLGLGTKARADKTLMWLMDQYQTNLDSIAQVTKVYVPHFADTGKAKDFFYYGTTDLLLKQTTAYAPPIAVNKTYDNTGLPDSLKMPKELSRWWYMLPNFNPGNFRGGMLNVMIDAVSVNHQYQAGGGPGGTPIISKQLGTVNGQTGQLNQSSSSKPGFVDDCIAKVKGDTVWFISNPNNQAGYTGETNLKCLDHNPFWDTVGTVHVLNPWPGKTVWAQLGTTWYPLYQEEGRLGWVVATLYADPRSPQPFKIRLANGDPSKSTAVQYMDVGGLGSAASGVPFDFTVTPGTGGEVWIEPPTTNIGKPTITTTAPPLALTLYIKRPTWSASAVRVLWQGNDNKFTATATKYCNWFVLNFYKGAVPTKILLTNPIGDTVYGAKGKAKMPTNLATFADWIDITLLAATGGSKNINTDGNTPLLGNGEPTGAASCDTKVLAFSSYNYSDGKADSVRYAPFAEDQSGVFYPGTTTSTDNCPKAGGGAMKGLVKPTLNAQGFPVWSGKVDCNIGTTDHGPQYWYDTLWRTSAGKVTQTKVAGATQLNWFKCIRVPLTLDAAGQYFSFSNGSFFPMDSAKEIPSAYHPANGNDFHFAMHAKAAFEYVPGLKFEFNGDDDVWIFIDRKLVLDIGGMHSAVAGSIDVDALGLVEGRSYQFDMFYNERHGQGSSMAIKTTMNLVPIIDVRFDTSYVGTKQIIKSFVTETTTDASRCIEEGATTSTNERKGNPNYTLVFPDGTEMSVDSVYLATSLPGASISDNGAYFEIDTSKVQKSGRLTQSGLYQIRVELGTELRLVSFSNVSKAVEVTGTLYDANGDGRADSVVLKAAGGAAAFKNTFSALLRWADRSGMADSVLVPSGNFSHSLTEDVLSGAFSALRASTSCPPTGCKPKMGFVYTGFGTDTVVNPIVELADGMAPVADSAWLVYDTTDKAQDTLYVVASEGLAAFSGLLPIGDSAFVLAGRTNASRPIAGTAILVGNLLKLPLDPATNPIQPGDSIRLGGYSGDALGNAPGLVSKWVYLKSDPVAKSWMLDVNGDGYPDSIGIGAKGSLATTTKATVHWKTSTGLDTTFVISTPSGVTNGLKLPVGILKNATYCAGCYLELDMGAQTKKFTLLDSVAPVALDAKLRYGTSFDTLLVTVSESFEIGSGAGEGVAAVKSGTSASVLVTGTATATGTTLRVLVAAGSIEQDSLRLRAWILGNLKKAVGVNSPYVKIVYGPQPIRVAVFDKNGDGTIDSVTYRLTRSAAGAPTVTEFGLTWGGQSMTVGSLALSSDGMVWSGPVVSAPLLTAPSSGDQGWLVVDADVTSYRASVEDSVAPVAFSASLVFGLEVTDPDTLRIEPSESFTAVAGTYAIVGTDSASTTTKTITNANSKLLTGSTTLQLVVASGAIDNAMTWVRLGSAIADNGKAVGPSSRWVKLKLKPSGRASLFDADGDGRADSMRVFVRGAMSASQAVLTWKTKSGATDSRTWSVAPSVGPFGVHPSDPLKWFQFGATECKNCTVTFLDAAGGTLVEWPLADSVAPIALSGKYSFGASQDTLAVTFSEGLVSIADNGTWLEWGNTVLGGAIKHSIVRPSPSGPTALFLLQPANGAVEGWDSLRLAVGQNAGSVADSSRKIVGAASPWAPITYGIAPFQAWLLDPNGKGQGTDVRVTLTRRVPQAAVAAIDGFQFSWTNSAANGLDTRDAKVSDLVWNGSDSSWTGTLPTPFVLGQTGCVSGCAAIAIAKDDSRRGASLQDSVPPSAVSTKFRYSLPEVALDTLILKLSEAWVGEDAGNLVDAFAKVGGSATGIDVLPLRDWQLVDGTNLYLVVSDTFASNLSQGDSARLAYLPQGSRVWDASKNYVGIKSRWVPIEFGLRPPRLEVKPYRPVLENTVNGGGAWEVPPASYPQIELLEKKKDGSFSKLQASGGGVIGGAPVNDTAHTLGVDIRINRPLEGVLIVYDNMGVAVVSIDLSPLKSLWKDEQDAEKTIRIQWNGTGPDHKFVSSGVYLFRAVVKFQDKEGKKDFRNIVWKLGFHRDTK